MGCVTHPSGLPNDGELAYASMEFWIKVHPELPKMSLEETYSHLLTFQQGWKACKDYQKLHE